jgi:hypothetical protein
MSEEKITEQLLHLFFTSDSVPLFCCLHPKILLEKFPRASTRLCPLQAVTNKEAQLPLVGSHIYKNCVVKNVVTKGIKEQQFL